MKSYVNKLATVSALSLQIATTVVVSLVAGWYVDDWLRCSPVFTLIFAALGFVAAMYTVYKRLVTSDF